MEKPHWHLPLWEMHQATAAGALAGANTGAHSGVAPRVMIIGNAVTETTSGHLGAAPAFVTGN
jgi:hypothetical protein